MVQLTRLYARLLTHRTMSSLVESAFSKGDIKKIIPPLTHDLHKGQCGRIAVIGGSLEYTGAPYYAAMTALRLGADLVHVFCTKSAGPAIKSYNPDLIVHPILDMENGIHSIKKDWLPRMHAVVIGPGLGRDMASNTFRELMKKLKSMEIPTIIDADGLHYVTEEPSLLTNFKNVIITPNIVEYDRLVQMCDQCLKAKDKVIDVSNEAFLTHYFPDLLVVRKGPVDRIFDWASVCQVDGGSARRCGGQGDVLAGAIALFTYWSIMTKATNGNILAAYAGCFFTRKLNERVFNEKGRSMLTGDFIDRIGVTFEELFCQE